MKVQKCWKWTYNILVGEGLPKQKSKVLEMDLQYFFGGRRLTKQKCKGARMDLQYFGGGGVSSFWLKIFISAGANFTTLSTRPLSVDGQ